MGRGSKLLLGLAIGLAFAGDEARGQYYYPYGRGYGGYGFGGWGQTAQGSIAAGMGAFAAGAGRYNYDTAAARSINTDSVMRWNNYVWSAQNSLNREHYVRMAAKEKRNNTAYDAIQERILKNPTDVDVQHGDALNAILEILTHPEFLQGSGLARLDAEIGAKVVRNIPFRYAGAAVVITIDRYQNDIPPLLQSGAVAKEREAFQAALKPALDEVKAGEDVSSKQIQAVRTAGQALYQKVESGLPDATVSEKKAALDYLNSLRAFLKMLSNPDVAEHLRELEKVQSTTLGNLIAFMHTYNLRFGPATEPDQKEAYQALYPLMAAQRDRILEASGGQPMPPPPTAGSVPTDLFQGIEPQHLDAAPSTR